MFQHLARFARAEDGAVAIEYALLAALIAMAMAIGAGLLGTGLGNFFQAIADKVASYLPAT